MKLQNNGQKRFPGGTTQQLPAHVLLQARSFGGTLVVGDLRALSVAVTQKDTATTAMTIRSAGASYVASLLDIINDSGVTISHFGSGGSFVTADDIRVIQTGDVGLGKRVSLGTDSSVNFGVGGTTVAQIKLTAAGELSITDYIVLPTKLAFGADPPAPATGVAVYPIDSGAGKTELRARFPTGATQLLAVEP